MLYIRRDDLCLVREVVQRIGEYIAVGGGSTLVPNLDAPWYHLSPLKWQMRMPGALVPSESPIVSASRLHLSLPVSISTPNTTTSKVSVAFSDLLTKVETCAAAKMRQKSS